MRPIILPSGRTLREVAAVAGVSPHSISRRFRAGWPEEALVTPREQFIDLTGQRFGRLSVIRRSPRSADRKAYWICRCDCGKGTTVLGNRLRSGHTKSCGCARLDAIARAQASATTHGMTGTPTHESWTAMRERCTRRRHHAYALYGGRGITICERWLTFQNFLADMGERPAGKSLDRIDNDGNYEPGNCRWATSMEQANNTRVNNRLTHNGETRSITEWARISGIRMTTIRARIEHGWSVERALTEPTHRSRE